MQIDPTGVRAPSRDGRASDTPTSEFHELMAQQLRHAPWLAISVLLHAIAIMIFLALPTERRLESERKITMAPPEKVDELPPPPPPDVPPPEPDQPPEDIELQEPVLDELDNPTEIDSELIAPTDTPVSALHSNALNTAVGLAGGAAGPGGNRGKRRGGAPRPTIEVVERSLKWLAAHQDEDGRWDADGFMKHDSGDACDGAGSPVHDVGVTGLAVLAFLADDHTLNRGRYRDNLKRAVHWLRSQQQENGLIGSNASHSFVYDHSIATLALVETAGLSPSRMLRPYAARALGYLEAHRNPYMVWRYQPASGENDTSITGWAVLAYKSAKDFDFPVNERALELAGVWLDQMTDAQGRCGYLTRGGLSSRMPGDHAVRFPPERSECMTAVGLLCRAFLGQKMSEEPRIRAGANLILAKPPVWNEGGGIDHYYWYYGTYALYQIGGAPWKQWSKALSSAVVRTQRRDGNYDGSWDPAGAWGEDGGRVYSTAILTLTMQAYYRYSRVLLR